MSMKKFSSITGTKVSVEPAPKERKLDPVDMLKFEVRAIMDSFLKVQIYGPINPILQGTLKVSGQEMFIEALMDLLESKTKKDTVKLLESLKSEISDWQVLDAKMDEIKNQIEESNRVQISKHKETIRNFYNRYKDDENLMMEQLDKSVNRMKSGKTAFYRSKAAEELSNELPRVTLKKISEKYLNKSILLGVEK